MQQIYNIVSYKGSTPEWLLPAVRSGPLQLTITFNSATTCGMVSNFKNQSQRQRKFLMIYSFSMLFYFVKHHVLLLSKKLEKSRFQAKWITQ